MDKTGFMVFAVVFLLLFPSLLSAGEMVTKVKDGDTVVAGHYTCRLYGIDAPETAHGRKSAQPYGEESKKELESLILGNVVEVQTTGAKTYNRDVCRIFLDGKDVNLEMVKRGYAWAYVQYLKRPHASEYIDAERAARRRRLGLWQDYNPTPPWEFRHKRKR